MYLTQLCKDNLNPVVEQYMGHTEKFPLKLRLSNGENYMARKKEESNVRNKLPVE